MLPLLRPEAAKPSPEIGDPRRRGTIGVVVTGATASDTLANIRLAEHLGIGAVWLTSGGGGGDSLTVLAAAAEQTERVLLGTSIMQLWSRHPVAVAQSARVIAAIAPGRLRLGIGPGHQQDMEWTFGVDYRTPLSHLREYIRILKQLLQQGEVHHEGQYYVARAGIPEPLDVPVLGSALRRRSFEMCGAEADGAITWVCPQQYVREVALPSLRDGALQAGRDTPPLLVHAPICVHEDMEQVRTAVRKEMGYFPRSRSYSRMFADAGFPKTRSTGWTDDLIAAVTLAGDEDAVTQKLDSIFARGVSEVVATVITAGEDRASSAQRTMRLLAEYSAL